MKRIFCVSIMILIGYSLVNAQNFKLKVISDNAPLGYAYVYINGQAYCSADSNGVALIPVSLLKIGDTLSASFVGTKDNSLIYTNKVAQLVESSINLEQSLILSDVVFTSYRDSKKLFKKYVNIYKIAYMNYELNGDFILNTKSDGAPQKIQGTFKHQLVPDIYRIRTGDTGLSIETDSDTSGLKSKFDFFSLITFARIAVNFPNQSIFPNSVVINYKGESNGERVFFITLRVENLKTDLQSHQTLIFVNKKTRNITHAKDIVLGYNGNRFDINVDYQINKKNKVIYPIKIQGNKATPSGKLIQELNAENITLHRIPLRNFNLQAPANKK